MDMISIRRKLMAHSAKPILPPAYTQVNYIQHELDGAIILISNYDCDIHNCDIFITATIMNQGDGEKAYAGYSSVVGATGKPWELYYKADLWNATGMIVVDHSIRNFGEKGTVHLKNGSGNNIDSLMLGHYRYGGYQCVNRQHGCRIERDGEVLRNLIPCYRNSDHEPGMYDTITGKFYTNAGQGSFTLP